MYRRLELPACCSSDSLSLAGALTEPSRMGSAAKALQHLHQLGAPVVPLATPPPQRPVAPEQDGRSGVALALVGKEREDMCVRHDL